uniref:Uncharacterized protein n=1 Tax=Arundo donax TaxID=35708 RepID=A0A0A9H2C1_ARUDO
MKTENTSCYISHIKN